jgi:hypothetical protein
MSNGTFPLHELRALLAPAAPLAGVVVGVQSTLIEVATPTGLRKARQGGRALLVGERVTVRDGAAYPAASAGGRYVL